MSTEDNALPTLKKTLKFTPVSIRIMEMCEKAYDSQKFLLLYFTNRKCYVRQFLDPKFPEMVNPRFEFFHLSRADKSGNWLTTTYRFKSSPFYAILDPSNGSFLKIHYGDLNLQQLETFLNSFISTNPKYELSYCQFPTTIEEIKENKRRAAYSYGTKIKVTFQSTKLPQINLFVNKSAPLRCAFESFCKKQNVDVRLYYFMYHGVQLPPEMTALQFHIKNNDIIYVHLFEDKNSTEPLSVTVIGIDGETTTLNVQKGRVVGSVLRMYCENHSLNPSSVRFTHKNDIVDESLTFGEHNISNGDQIIVQQKPVIPTVPPPASSTQNEYYYHYMKQNDMQQQQMPQGPPTVSLVPDIFEMQLQAQHNPNVMFMYNQPIPRNHPMPPPPFNQINSSYGMPTKQYPYQKQMDTQPQNLWESFE
ncbi:ubiquitin-like modifier [Histomonas meleagridis]|uniref:ubiquitin-like modifier n=1 Tax=Histomonas meleagridis TaxID=135588 RepID=UPI00355A7A24|nr:ubiquitin-like modifier [Histomonas meleagridis]KAH0802185.1 ubiquitin-like modifier [Histomonas meleagridis]